MAILKQARDVSKLTVTQTRRAYEELKESYEKLVNLDIIYCHEDNHFVSRRDFYITDKNKSGVIPICKDCLFKMATDYNPQDKTYTDNKDKAKKTLRAMDLPFINTLYDSMCQKVKNGANRNNYTTGWNSYIAAIQSLPIYRGKTWADSTFDKTDLEYQEPTEEMKKLFGRDFSNEDYLYLYDQYKDWCDRTQVDSKSQQVYVVRICFKLLDIWKAQKKGENTKELDKSLNELMASANLQPRQNVNNAATDSLTFGQLIEKWEKEKPIPEPTEEFKDVDGIGKYIRVWFKGHLARMLGFDNGYSKEYDDYIKNYTCHKPTYEDDTGNSDIYSKLFTKEGE